MAKKDRLASVWRARYTQILWDKAMRMARRRPKTLRCDIPEGAMHLPAKGWGKIRSAPALRERYVTVSVSNDRGPLTYHRRVFIAWGRYGWPYDKRFHRRHWYA